MRRIEIYDTTLRDGSQAEGISFSLYEKLLLTERLDRLGFDYVEGGYPSSNEKDAQYFQRTLEADLKHVKICAFGMTRRKGIQADQDNGLTALLSTKANVITLVGKASSFQVTDVLQTELDENLAMIDESIRYLLEAGHDHVREIIFDAEHYFDGWKTNPGYVLKVLETAVRAGAGRIVLCDTNGGSMCEEVFDITRKTVEAIDIPVGVHCHNDCDLAVANTLAAVRAGASHVQGTINGFGERCGNADLISIIANLAIKYDEYEILGPNGSEHLTELSRYVYEMVNVNMRPHQPFVGRSAFAHKAGMHVSGISRNVSSYEHIPPESVGNERRVLVSELSGRSNLVELSTKYNIKNDPKLMEKILTHVISMESAGYQFEAAEGSFDLLVKRCAGSFRPHFERINYHVNVETREDGKTITEATVKIRVGDEIRHEVAEGDGPVNALDAAMRKALNGHYPSLQKTHLVDYKVRVINSEAATAAGVRVIIETQDESDLWGTVGVSENIIEASWHALVDSLEYKLCKDDEKAAK